MKLTAQEKQIISGLVAELRKKLGALEIILYGSAARGELSEGSDIDLLVILPSVDWAIEKQVTDLLQGVDGRDSLDSRNVSIRPASEVDDLKADYASTGLTLGKHPLAFIRKELHKRRVRPASELLGLPHGSRVRACGLITMRQRPMTANGTIFLTLEDETG